MRRPLALLVRPLLAAVAGTAVAGVVVAGVLVSIEVAPDPEPWGDLGRFLLGLGAGALLGLVVWVLLLVHAARRLFAPGRRLQPVGLSIAVVVGTWLLAAGLGPVATSAGGPGGLLGRTLTGLAVLVVVVGPSLVFRWAARAQVPAR